MKYDVVIIGGGTAGCAAAYTSGKLGLKTLLLEKGIHLGGSITSGLVIPVMKSGDNQINTDFYSTLIKNLNKINGQITYQNNPGWFNPELTKIVLDKMMEEANVEIRYNSEIISTQINNKNILSINVNNTLSVYNEKIHANNISSVSDDMLSVPIEAKYYIDATGDLNFSQKINCEFLNDNSQFQPISLRFIMSGINLNTFSKWLENIDTDRNVTSIENINGSIHLSTAYTWDTNKNWALAPLFDNAVSENILKDTDRNYFQIFTVAGTQDSIAFNCPRIIKKLNPNLIEDRTTALIEGRQAILRLSNFCKKYFPGFENSYISNIADMLGIRVSNRIKGKYIYTIDDLKSGKTFTNPVLISDYPIDVHSTNKNTSTLEKTGEYQLPIESLMSNDFDNLFVAGRGISADYMAQGALRVQASCFSMGEGVAKYIYNLINKV